MLPNNVPPSDPTVIQVLKKHRQLLDAKESAMMDEMGTQWIKVEQRVEANISALAEEMARRKAAGEIVTDQMVRLSQYYKSLQAQLIDEIHRYNNSFASPFIKRAQDEYASLGIETAQDALTSIYSESGMLPSFGKINPRVVQDMIGYAGDGSPLKLLLQNDYPKVIGSLINSLIEGIARGVGAGETARMMRDSMGIGLDKSLLIARTETNRVYRTASTAQYQESGVVTGYMRLVKKETACIACLFLDGEVYPVQGQMEDHPMGKCMEVPIVEGVNAPEWETGKQYFDNLSGQEQRDLLGDARYEMYQSGQVSLDDLVGVNHSETWGDQPQVVSLGDLRDNFPPDIINVGPPPDQSGGSPTSQYEVRQADPNDSGNWTRGFDTPPDPGTREGLAYSLFEPEYSKVVVDGNGDIQASYIGENKPMATFLEQFGFNQDPDLMAQINEYTQNGSTPYVLDAIAVAPINLTPEGQIGWGTKAFYEVVKEAQEGGCDFIALQAEPSAINFYEAVGMANINDTYMLMSAEDMDKFMSIYENRLVGRGG